MADSAKMVKLGIVTIQFKDFSKFIPKGFVLFLIMSGKPNCTVRNKQWRKTKVSVADIVFFIWKAFQVNVDLIHKQE